jgi:succinate dehydrogenase / fumarate reductase flavoprotein subunit
MGGLWVDYDLMTTIPGLFAIGEANFSDHGANRLGASALMQGLADGYFVLPLTVGGYLAGAPLPPLDDGSPAARGALAETRARVDGLCAARGRRTASDFHRAAGRVLREACGLSRQAAPLRQAVGALSALREEFRDDLRVPGGAGELNQELERAGRVADFLELGQLMCQDALAREESCGCHFRVEHQTPDGEARRDDEGFAHVAAWLPGGAAGDAPRRVVEPLSFEALPLRQRSYR